MAKLSWPPLGVSSEFDVDHKLVSSPVFPPLLLAFLRLLFGVYTLTVLVTSLAYDSVHDPDQLNGYFAYFTHLSYIGICAYFWASGVQTLFYALGHGYPLQKWPRILQFLHLLLFSTIATFPFITTIIFWALLSSSSTFATTFDTWNNVSVHAMNSAFALFEILLTHAGPTPFAHIPFCLLLLALYLCVAYITHATQGFYTYSFLNPAKQHGLVAAYVAAVGIGECLLFTFSWVLCTLRERISSKRVEHGSLEELAENWEEVSRIGSMQDV